MEEPKKADPTIAIPKPKTQTLRRPPYTMEYVDLTPEDMAEFDASFTAVKARVLELHEVADREGWQPVVANNGQLVQFVRRRKLEEIVVSQKE